MVNLNKNNNVHIIKTKYLLTKPITPFRFLGSFLIICKFDFHLWPWPFPNILWWPWPFPTNEDRQVQLYVYILIYDNIIIDFYLLQSQIRTCRMIRQTETRSLIIGTNVISKNDWKTNYLKQISIELNDQVQIQSVIKDWSFYHSRLKWLYAEVYI